MRAVSRRKKIFLDSQGMDLAPRVVSKRSFKNRSGNNEKLANLDILTIEIACYVDQRVLLEEDVESIKVFLSDTTHTELRTRRNLLSEVFSPKVSFDSAKFRDKNTKTKTSSRKESADMKLSRLTSEKNERLVKPNRQSVTRGLSNVIYDIDNLNTSMTASRFSGLSFLTKFNINQHLSSIQIKNIQGLKQTDDELFGTRDVLRLKKIRNSKFRTTNRTGKRVSLDLPSVDLTRETPSEGNFRRSYFREIKMSRDPLSCFDYADPHLTIEDRTSGRRSLNKVKPRELREKFKKIAQEKIEIAAAEDLGFQIEKTKRTNRNRLLKTTFEMQRRKIKTLTARRGAVNLIFYAFDSSGRRIDSFSVTFTDEDLKQTEINPTLDFQISASRNRRGNVVSVLKNEEMQKSEFNLYEKAFAKTQNFKKINFSVGSKKITVPSNSQVSLIDGNISRSKSVLHTKTKTVFQRVTPDFRDQEIANTKSASAANQVLEAAQMSCSVYVIEETAFDAAQKTSTVAVTNLSEDVYAILPVKRVSRGTRGSDFKPIKFLDSNNSLVENTKTFVSFENVEEMPTFYFSDDDIKDDVVYEYAVILFSRSGDQNISASRYLSKINDPEGLVELDVSFSFEGRGKETYDGQRTSNVSFEVMINREEDNIDKLINSIFGDNRALFEEELKEIKDASNLLYGVRVHRIDTLTGENSFIGSFRGYKQEDDTSVSSTDIPKQYRVTFVDNCPVSTRQIYKFEPYIIPPSQILDKVFASLELSVRNRNRSRSTLNRQSVTIRNINNNINKTVSSIGSKYATGSGRRGRITSTSSFLERNQNDLFIEGLTGDLVFTSVSLLGEVNFDNSLPIEDSHITSIKTLDRNTLNRNYVPKELIEIDFEVNTIDILVDFYVVVKQLNKDPELIIDGAIHSKDLGRLRQSVDEVGENLTYTYLSSTNTSVGLIRYYLFGVSKSGSILGPAFLGGVTLKGN